MNQTNELEVVSQPDAQLVEYAGKIGLEQSSTAPLVAAYRPVFAEARVALAAAVGVAAAVKDATCVSEIKQARACRLAIRKVRLAGEAVRKAQKANALAYGRAVDGFYNILEADLSPVEKELQDAEDTAERAEVARKDALESGRKAALAPYVPDVSLYAVRDMTDAAFAALLTGVKVAKEQADAAAAKAEADRIAKEKEDAAERERIRAENERLRKEAVAREEAARIEREAAEKKLAAERAEAARIAAEIKAKSEAEARAAAAQAAIEKAEIEAKAKAAKEAADAQAAKERAAREKAEAEARALREAEARRKAEAEEAAMKAAAAPDKEKLRAYADSIDGVDLPALATKAASRLRSEVERLRDQFTAEVRAFADKL